MSDDLKDTAVFSSAAVEEALVKGAISESELEITPIVREKIVRSEDTKEERKVTEVRSNRPL